jgi:hypothetical protein
MTAKLYLVPCGLEGFPLEDHSLLRRVDSEGVLRVARALLVPRVSCGLPERCCSRSLVLPRVSCGLP